MARAATARRIDFVPMAVAVAVALAACDRGPSNDELDACHGPPLRTAQLREKALQDGYSIHKRFDCIDRASFDAVTEAISKRQAANTPSSVARREAQAAKAVAQESEGSREQARADGLAQRERGHAERAAANDARRAADVNTATESQLAVLPGVGPLVAAQIVEERNKGRFDDWEDLVRRVGGISAASTAMLASIGGLTVNGESLDGAPADPAPAAASGQTQR